MTASDPTVTRLFGGPGSGKTTALLDRVEEMLENDVDVSDVLVVSYTRAAAQEVRERLAERLDPEHPGLFTGAQERMAEVFALADVVVSSSRKPESFGRTLTEALAMETPVIATAHGGPLDIVRPGADGFLFPPGDPEALAEALQRTRATRFKGLRKAVLARFSLEKTVERLLELYRELAAAETRP